MNRLHRIPRLKLAATTISLAVLSGCASVDFDQAVVKANRDTADFTQGKLSLAQNGEQRGTLQRTAAELLKQPLGPSDAVQLALVNNPALQALLAQNWADATSAAQTGHLAHSISAFERIEHAQLRLTADVIDHVTQVRQAWVRAVAAQQILVYARQVFASAEASAELARRMRAAGNFSALARARQQAFYADAATQWAAAQHAATAAREQLVRPLGLTEAQSRQLRLPERLPDLPKAPRDPAEVSNAANAGRLDIRIAQSSLESAATAQGQGVLTSVTGIELGVRRDSKVDNVEGSRTTGHGHEISVRAPLFDWSGMQRDAMTAQTLAAANRLEATVRAAGSNLREGYSAYRTTYDIARHYRDEVLPLRKTISEENVLRYNGMLIGVFELLADSRDQVSSVMATIAAEQQFWLADAALQASIMGRPTMAFIGSIAPGTDRGGHSRH